MAGLGRKTFTAGEVLTAANVNGYLMDQAVMVFDDSAARGSAIASPSEGMLTYLKDTNSVQYYDGAAWESIGGDPAIFTSGTAGQVLSSAGTAGLVWKGGLTSSTAVAYTIANSDAGNLLRFTNAGTVTISTAAAFIAGQQVQIIADGTALAVTASGVTLAGAGTAGTAITFSVGNRYEALSLVCVDTNAYRIIGNVSAA